MSLNLQSKIILASVIRNQLPSNIKDYQCELVIEEDITVRLPLLRHPNPKSTCNSHTKTTKNPPSKSCSVKLIAPQTSCTSTNSTTKSSPSKAKSKESHKPESKNMSNPSSSRKPKSMKTMSTWRKGWFLTKNHQNMTQAMKTVAVKVHRRVWRRTKRVSLESRMPSLRYWTKEAKSHPSRTWTNN